MRAYFWEDVKEGDSEEDAPAESIDEGEKLLVVFALLAE